LEEKYSFIIKFHNFFVYFEFQYGPNALQKRGIGRSTLKTWSVLPMYASSHNTSTRRFGWRGCKFMEKHNDPYPITDCSAADHFGLGWLPIRALEHHGAGQNGGACGTHLHDQPLGGKA
jgi:hypothetical protein